jgi:hypothetical protein
MSSKHLSDQYPSNNTLESLEIKNQNLHFLLLLNYGSQHLAMGVSTVLIDISHPNSCTFCYEEANDGEHSPTEIRQYNRILFSFVTTEFQVCKIFPVCNFKSDNKLGPINTFNSDYGR